MQTTCVIAGGGPAGIVLGYLLARAGVEVAVLEKWPDFFRDFRGDTIHPSTLEVLSDLGLLTDFLKLPYNEMRSLSVFVAGPAVTIADFSHLPVECPFIAFIPQWDFLNFMTAAAQRYPAFHLLMKTEATELLKEGDAVVGLRAKSPDGELEIRADLVIGADGRHSTVRDRAELPLVDSGAPIDVLWFRLSRDEHAAPDQSLGYIGPTQLVILLDRDDYWQCGFIIKKGSFDEIKLRGLPAFRASLVAVAPFLAPVAGEIDDWEKVKMLSVAVNHLTTWHRKGLLCIGDAAHAMSPVGGIGINLAIQDAVASANILIPRLRAGNLSEQDLAAVQLRRESPTLKTQKLQVFAHRRVLAPVMDGHGPTRPPWLLRIVKLIPALARIPARIIGIGFRPEHPIDFSAGAGKPG